MADQKLKKAMEEIKFILDRYDIAGTVALSTNKDLEYLYRLTPSWSIVTVEEETGYVGVKALRKDYSSKEEQVAAITDSANMMFGLRKVNQAIAGNLSTLTDMLEQKFDIDFKTSSHQPHIDAPVSTLRN